MNLESSARVHRFESEVGLEIGQIVGCGASSSKRQIRTIKVPRPTINSDSGMRSVTWKISRIKKGDFYLPPLPGPNSVLAQIFFSRTNKFFPSFDFPQLVGFFFDFPSLRFFLSEFFVLIFFHLD